MHDSISWSAGSWGNDDGSLHSGDHRDGECAQLLLWEPVSHRHAALGKQNRSEVTEFFPFSPLHAFGSGLCFPLPPYAHIYSSRIRLTFKHFNFNFPFIFPLFFYTLTLFLFFIFIFSSPGDICRYSLLWRNFCIYLLFYIYISKMPGHWEIICNMYTNVLTRYRYLLIYLVFFFLVPLLSLWVGTYFK